MGRRKRKKKIVEQVRLTGIADKGRAVGRDPEGQVYFVEGAVPGDLVQVEVQRKKKGVPFGRVAELTEASPERIDAFCKHFELCGGCKWQNLSYEAQLKYKEAHVKNVMQRIAKVDIEEWLPVLACKEEKHYRNKLEFSFSSARWMTEEEIQSDEIILDKKGLGFNKAGTFDKVIDLTECYLQAEPSNSIRNWLRQFTANDEFPYYNSRSRKGWLRNIMLRSTEAGEWLVLLSIAYEDEEKRCSLLDKMIETFPAIKSVFYVISDKMNSTTIDLDYHHYYGEEVLVEHLGDVAFKIGPKSFFQTNTKQAKRLYDVVKDFADFKGNENVYDLYTGLGSIALYLADQVKSITGIEEIPEAIHYAKINTSFNNISNARFYVGDVKDILTDGFVEKHGAPDVIITDPPRVGMHKDVVQTLLLSGADKIVYVSCNPATQARDLSLLSEQYKVVKIQTVDMFPHTHHIETVALLHKKTI